MATQAEETLHRCLEIILIGPVCTEKSTLAPLLADRLQVSRVSLDRISLTYLEELGYGEATLRNIQQELNQEGATLGIVQQGFLATSPPLREGVAKGDASVPTRHPNSPRPYASFANPASFQASMPPTTLNSWVKPCFWRREQAIELR